VTEGDVPLRVSRGTVVLQVAASPGARRDEVGGMLGGRLRVRVAAPAEAGRANEALVRVVAAAFGLRRADVTIVAGASSRRKDLALSGLTLEDARARLDAIRSKLMQP
jgi:hypothetical protein